MSKAWKWFWRVLAVLLLCLLVAAAVAYKSMRDMGFFREPVFETEPPAVPELARPALLVFSKTNAFIHVEAIPAAQQLMREIGAEQGWSVFVSDNGALHNPVDLARFDVIVWNNVTGDVLNPAQRQALREWLEQGGGFVALHSAGDDSHEVWPWYIDTVIRARFVAHPMNPQFQRARLPVEQPADPIVAHLGDAWEHEDEWYSFEASPRAADLRVLLSIDESSYSPQMFGRSLAMGSDHPMIWKHCVGAGRVLYSAPGHTAETYALAAYRELLRRAITWAGRLDESAMLPAQAALACETP